MKLFNYIKPSQIRGGLFIFIMLTISNNLLELFNNNKLNKLIS